MTAYSKMVFQYYAVLGPKIFICVRNAFCKKWSLGRVMVLLAHIVSFYIWSPSSFSRTGLSLASVTIFQPRDQLSPINNVTVNISRRRVINVWLDDGM